MEGHIGIPRDLAKTLVPLLDKKAFAAVCRAVLKIGDGFQYMAEEDVLLLGVYEWFVHLNLFTDVNLRALTERARPYVNEQLDEFRIGRRSDYHMRIAVVDRRYVGLTGVPTWYDTVHESEVEELPQPALTTISCDVRVLYVRQYVHLSALRGRKDATV